MIDHDKPVRVFKNWKYGCYNIMQNGRLLASAKQVRLSGVEFLVRESGRQRMLKLGARNIHAYAIGQLIDYAHPSENRDLDKITGRGVTYNPYESSSFVDAQTRSPVISAAMAQLDEYGVTYTD